MLLAAVHLLDFKPHFWLNSTNFYAKTQIRAFDLLYNFKKNYEIRRATQIMIML